MNTFVKADSLSGVFDTYTIDSTTYYDTSHITTAAIDIIDNKTVVFISANVADAGKFIDSYQIQEGDTFIWTHGIIYPKPGGEGGGAVLERDITPDITVGFVNEGDTSVLRAGMTLQQCMEAIFIGDYKYICGNFTASLNITQPVIVLSVQKLVDDVNDTWENINSGVTLPLGTTIRYKAEITPSHAIAGPLYMGKNVSAGILVNGYWKGNYQTTEIDTTSSDYGSGTYSDSSKTILNDSGTESLTIGTHAGAFSSADVDDFITDYVEGEVELNNSLSFTYGGITYTVSVTADTTIYAVSKKKLIFNTDNYYKTILNGTVLNTRTSSSQSNFTITGEASSYYYWGSDGSDETTIMNQVIAGFDSSSVDNFIRYTSPIAATALNGFLYILTSKSPSNIQLLDGLGNNVFANASGYTTLKSAIVDEYGVAYNLYKFPKTNPASGALYRLIIEN